MQHLCSTLCAALNLAVRKGLIESNPARHIEVRGYRRPHARVWTDDEVADWQATGQRPAVAVWTLDHLAAFLAAVTGDALYVLWWLVALRGLRRDEACGLRWSDVDLDRPFRTCSGTPSIRTTADIYNSVLPHTRRSANATAKFVLTAARRTRTKIRDKAGRNRPPTRPATGAHLRGPKRTLGAGTSDHPNRGAAEPTSQSVTTKHRTHVTPTVNRTEQ
jgi:integrase